MSTNVRYDNGRPLLAPVIRPFAPLPEVIQAKPGAGRRPCSKAKSQALAISNKFREAFGLPLIATEPYHHEMHHENDGKLKILPFIGTPTQFDVEPDVEPSLVRGPGVIHVAPGRGFGRGRRFHRSFFHRVHRALMVLGPWEGRAVAFVLGKPD